MMKLTYNVHAAKNPSTRVIGYAQQRATISRRWSHCCHTLCSSLNKMAIAWRVRAAGFKRSEDTRSYSWSCNRFGCCSIEFGHHRGLQAQRGYARHSGCILFHLGHIPKCFRFTGAMAGVRHPCWNAGYTEDDASCAFERASQLHKPCKPICAWWATPWQCFLLKRLGLACLTQKMNQNWHDKCDCYQLLSLRNSDIRMSSVHGVGCEVVTLSNMSRGESEFSWQLWLLSIIGFVEFKHSHVINAWCWICNWYILKFVKWYVVR